MRASGDPILEEFDKWTLSIGNGVNLNGGVLIPQEMITEIVPNTQTEPKNEELSMKKFNKILQCRIVESGRIVLIPRITFISKPREYPFEWQRRQFPVRPAFAMTINKSQGQTLKNAGVWLRGQVFTHGQLYVPCSRVSSPSNLKFALMRDQQGRTLNIVYQEVFQDHKE